MDVFRFIAFIPYPVGGWIFVVVGSAVEHSLQLGQLGFRAESTYVQSDPKHDSHW